MTIENQVTAGLVGFGVLFGLWVLSALTVAGWSFAYMQAISPGFADEDRREDLGCAILLGMLCGLLGPLGVLIAWLMTGLCQHGWRLRGPNAGDVPRAGSARCAEGEK